MLSAYAELHCRSNFSFLTGASHPEELVQRAHALGYSALAITDECSLAGVVRAHTEARRLGLHLVIGAEMQLHLPAAGGEAPLPHARLLLHAQSRRGYGNLSQWITACRRRAGKGQYLAHPTDLEGRLPHLPHLAGLPDCLALLLPPAVLDTPPRFEPLFAQAQWLQAWFGAERCGLALPLLHRRHDDELIDVVQAVAAASGLPIVATAVGGNPEVLADGVTGRLVPSEDDLAMAQALATYADDAVLAQRHGQAARSQAQARYGLAAMVQRYDTLFSGARA